MFLIRKFEEKDVPECAMCFYESFFNCLLTENDRAFLRDYAQVLAEKCSFTYVSESEGQVVGFIIGHYKKDFNKALAKQHDVKPHYKAWLRCFFKFAFGGYKMSAPFKAQFDVFYKKLKENGKDTPLACDCELMALCSRRDFRKREDGARVHRYGRHIYFLRKARFFAYMGKAVFLRHSRQIACI